MSFLSQLPPKHGHSLIFLFHGLFNGEAIDVEEGADFVDDEEGPAKVMQHCEDEVSPQEPLFRFRVVERQAVYQRLGMEGGILYANEGEIDYEGEGEER
jgi:hypothetical protein